MVGAPTSGVKKPSQEVKKRQNIGDFCANL